MNETNKGTPPTLHAPPPFLRRAGPHVHKKSKNWRLICRKGKENLGRKKEKARQKARKKKREEKKEGMVKGKAIHSLPPKSSTFNNMRIRSRRAPPLLSVETRATFEQLRLFTFSVKEGKRKKETYE